MTSSDQPTRSGILYIVAVPIGHPDDLTMRAIRILGKADLIASEDPASTGVLLAHHGIEAALTSYGPGHLKEKVAILIHRLQRGAHVALVSECGSPVIADPGCFLVAAAHSHGIQVVSVPGASALTAAVAAAGLSGDTFFFQGCLPESTSSMKRCLADCLKNQTSTVAFCTPISLALVLRTIAEIAPRRSIALACDLTKPEELIIRGTARQVQQRLDSVPEPQDVTLILTGGKTIADKRAGKK